MDWSKAPLLFTPSRPPIRLEPDRVVVIGRSHHCDVPLPSPEASRRHAEIRLLEGAWTVRDLGSTNGTRVNGETVSGERKLRPGDRIEIAGQDVTFCQIESRPAPPESTGDTKTVLFRPRSDGEAMRGDLAEIPSFAVLQILEMGRKTGVLEISGEGREGRIWLENGAPIHAEAKGMVGFDAAVALVQAGSGRFSFESRGDRPEPTIRISVTQLLLEASRLLDERARGDAD